MKLSEKMIVPNQQKEENFLMKVSRPPTSNKRPTTNHLQKSPNRGHRVIYVKKDVEQRPSTTSSIVPQYKTPRYVPVTYPSVRKTIFAKEMDTRLSSGPFAFFKDNIATKRAKHIVPWINHHISSNNNNNLIVNNGMAIGNQKRVQNNKNNSKKKNRNKVKSTDIDNKIWNDNKNGTTFSKSYRFVYDKKKKSHNNKDYNVSPVPQTYYNRNINKSSFKINGCQSSFYAQVHNRQSMKRTRKDSLFSSSSQQKQIEHEKKKVVAKLRFEIPNINLTKKYKSINQSTENLFKHLQH